jgi:hypothetical protein
MICFSMGEASKPAPACGLQTGVRSIVGLDDIAHPQSSPRGMTPDALINRAALVRKIWMLTYRRQARPLPGTSAGLLQ